MLLAYDSLTGNVRRLALELAGQLGAAVVDVRTQAPAHEYLLLTYTFGCGQAPDSTRNFLDQHSPLLRGVVASGSYHWGNNFARAADVIAARYGVPVVAKVNKGGTAADRVRVLTWLREHNRYGTLD
ncbi:protein NrdI [Deinococcus aerolatus]|uniref:Protein NrdI n=1 Tax=Deinococcus aerolatus TaxID=522487 RepID=A0ABQ2GER3_9DEIO|nr:class Ib ribonucleoside-diphosphate reductase assembly flavoprotein NrdI [Deinococcus aerolatus]GGL90295.1 protein NrdI [Deinococcus aerolatus]